MLSPCGVWKSLFVVLLELRALTLVLKSGFMTQLHHFRFRPYMVTPISYILLINPSSLWRHMWSLTLRNLKAAACWVFLIATTLIWLLFNCIYVSYSLKIMSVQTQTRSKTLIFCCCDKCQQVLAPDSSGTLRDELCEVNIDCVAVEMWSWEACASSAHVTPPDISTRLKYPQHRAV